MCMNHADLAAGNMHIYNNMMTVILAYLNAKSSSRQLSSSVSPFEVGGTALEAKPGNMHT